MTTQRLAAMATWVGALARGGLLIGHAEEEGVRIALDVLGEERLRQLRRWFRDQPMGTVDRERGAAIHVAIWMAHADNVLAPEEVDLLRHLIAESELSADAQRELEDALKEVPDLSDVEERLTEPGLRELVFALSMQLAQADGEVAEAEVQALGVLRGRFGISDARAAEIERALADA